jgi:hypothetical protein
VHVRGLVCCRPEDEYARIANDGMKPVTLQDVLASCLRAL